MNELLVATNPDPDSRLGHLLRLPLDGGMVFRTSDTWPRTKALYCYPVGLDEWPDDPDIVEQVPLRSCARRGAAIDLVLDRSRENRSQIVFTTARGRDAVFWQSPRTRKQARPNVSTPTARAGPACGSGATARTRHHRPRAVVKAIFKRFSLLLSSTRSMAAPRRAQLLSGFCSTI